MKKWCLIWMMAMMVVTFASCGEKEPAGSGSTVKIEPKEGYSFVYEGVTINIDALAEPIIEKLGEPASYFEAASCAFEGLDKMYTYSSVEVDTYPDEEGKDRISGIILKDDMVETQEGVSLFETKDDMIKAYGDKYTDENGVLVYSKDGMKLCFILEEDEIISIEYRTIVLD